MTDLAVVATAAAAGNIATAATQSRAGDTDTAPENSQTPTQDTDPAVAATAAASSELTNSSLLAFPLENAPTAAWASALTQSQSQAQWPWLSTMIASYTTFRHLLNDCTDPASGVWSEQSFYNNGVTESTDRIALQRWANANWERYLAHCPKPPPPPPPPPPPLPPAQVVAATAATVPAASDHATATCRSSWVPQLSERLAGLLLSKIDVPGSWSSDEQPALSSGQWKIAGVDVLVRFGPEAPRDCKRAIVFLPGTVGYSAKFLEAMRSDVQWPTQWEQAKHCIMVAIPKTTGRQEGQGGNASVWRAPLPSYMDDILAWLVQLRIFFLLFGFSRGSAWAAQLRTVCPTNLRGVVLAAGYHAEQGPDRQLEAARSLLKPRVPVVIVHSLMDSFSNPRNNPAYWNTLLRAEVGAGIDEKTENLTVVTMRDYNHDELQQIGEGLPDDSNLLTISNDTFKYLLHYLDLPG